MILDREELGPVAEERECVGHEPVEWLARPWQRRDRRHAEGRVRSSGFEIQGVRFRGWALVLRAWG